MALPGRGNRTKGGLPMSTPQQLVEETLNRLQIPYTLVEHPAVYTHLLLTKGAFFVV